MRKLSFWGARYARVLMKARFTMPNVRKHIDPKNYPKREFGIRNWPVNLGIGKCGKKCGGHVRRQNRQGKNVTNFFFRLSN